MSLQTDSEHRFSLCWIFFVCKAFNNPNEREIFLCLGLFHAINRPTSSLTLVSYLAASWQIPNPGFQRICVVVSSIPFHLQKCSRPIFSCSLTVACLTAMRPQQPASNTGCLLFCLPSQLFKNSISYLWKNHLLYRLHLFHSLVLNLRPLRTNGHTTFKDCVHRQPVVLVVGGGQRRPFFSSQEIFQVACMLVEVFCFEKWFIRLQIVHVSGYISVTEMISTSIILCLTQLQRGWEVFSKDHLSAFSVSTEQRSPLVLKQKCSTKPFFF